MFRNDPAFQIAEPHCAQGRKNWLNARAYIPEFQYDYWEPECPACHDMQWNMLSEQALLDILW